MKKHTRLEWSSSPRAGGRTTLVIIRLKANESYSGVILSDDALGCEIHYMGKSVPHTTPAEDCAGCEKGLGVRWEGYVGVFNAISHQIQVMPLTSAEKDQLDVYRDAHGTLRGCQIEKKRGKRDNSRCNLKLSRSSAPINKLPKDAEVMDCLSHMWGLNDNTVEHVVAQPERVDTSTRPMEDMGEPSKGPRLSDVGADHTDYEMRQAAAKRMTPAQIDAERREHQARVKSETKVAS